MKQRLFFPLFVLAVVVGFSSCSSKLNPLASDYIKATPQPLEVTAMKIPVTIDATFPQNWFHKNATVRITPVLKYSGGEALGTTYTYQGEKVAGNGQVIPRSTGGNVTMRSSFDYIPAMNQSELYLRFDAQIGNRSVSLPDVKIGDGVIATAALANAGTANAAIAPDAFQRIIKEAHDANIMFLIQQAELRSSELKKSEVTDWKNLVKSANDAANQNVNVEISAYASPDGGPELNQKLSQNRERNTNSYLTKELAKAKVDAPISARYTAQDWEGFKQLVEKSNIQDKNLILRVLSTYSDPIERETQIRNMSSVFSVLADEILPQLRRSRLIANVEIIGKSDAEISQLAASNPSALTVEELLYAATLVNTNEQKATIYQAVTQYFPNDFRGFNNLGVVRFSQGQANEAESLFKKAAQLSSQAPETNLNLGLVSMLNGDLSSAEQALGKAGNVSELNESLGILALKRGDYSKAVSYFGNTASNNAALAQILTKDYSKAQTTLNNVQNADATTAYLKAIVAARTNNQSGVISNLKSAISQDRSLATSALNDIEFVKFFNQPDFLNLLK